MSASLDTSLLPAVRSAQGALVASIFAHPAFDSEGDRMYGKLFYVFETTIASNEALEVAHLGEDTENATRGALDISIENNARVAQDANGNGKESEVLKLAKQRYSGKLQDGAQVEDVDLGDDIRAKAAAVRDAAETALGKTPES